MSRRGRQKASYIADPQRRAHLGALRTIRDQVLREHEKELNESGLWKRMLLRLRIEREIKKRMQEAGRPGVTT